MGRCFYCCKWRALNCGTVKSPSSETYWNMRLATAAADRLPLLCVLILLVCGLHSCSASISISSKSSCNIWSIHTHPEASSHSSIVQPLPALLTRKVRFSRASPRKMLLLWHLILVHENRRFHGIHRSVQARVALLELLSDHRSWCYTATGSSWNGYWGYGWIWCRKVWCFA